jgi:hypothetical protein
VFARSAHIYILRVRGKSIRTRRLDRNDGAARRVAPEKGPDPKLQNEYCSQVSPSQVRDAFGPHDGNEHTRQAIASDGVYSAQPRGPAGLVCSFPPSAPRCHSAREIGRKFAWESSSWLSPLRSPRTRTSDRDQRSGICETLQREMPRATAG